MHEQNESLFSDFDFHSPNSIKLLFSRAALTVTFCFTDTRVTITPLQFVKAVPQYSLTQFTASQLTRNI